MNFPNTVTCEYCEAEIIDECFSTFFADILCDSCYYGNTWRGPVTKEEMLKSKDVDYDL